MVESLIVESLIVESLIQDGRVPVHFGILNVGNKAPEMSFWIPPQGTQKGDTIEGSPTMGFRFESPEGQDRGFAKMHVVPMNVGEQIRDKVRTALRGIER